MEIWKGVRRKLAAAGLVFLSALAACGGERAGSTGEPPVVQARDHVVPAWFTDAKLGIFIHWGVYSVPAWAPVGQYAEWYWFFQQTPIFAQHGYHLRTYGASFLYDDFIPEFRAENWDPRDWIELIRNSGAKYWVLTTKHHDGFALWPTTTTDRNSVKLGPHRDIVGDLVKANVGSGLKAGLYYSLPEWFSPAPRPSNIYPGTSRLFETYHYPQDPYAEGHPQVPYTGYRPIDDYSTGQVIPQIEELIDRYHPSILWCDIGGDPSYFQSERWLTHFFTDGARHHPDGVTANNRCGAFGDFDTPEYAPLPAPGGRYFEATRGLGESFGYNQNEKISDYLTDAEAIHTLVDTVAGGGNLLLDIGPMADGTIPPVMRDRLLAIGQWLEINGEAIYATRPWSHPGSGSRRYTRDRHANLYVIAEEWPGDELVVDGPVPVSASTVVSLLGSDGTTLPFRSEADRLVISLPPGSDPSMTRSKHAFVFRVTNVSQQAEE